MKPRNKAALLAKAKATDGRGRCPICNAVLASGDMGRRSHLRRHLRRGDRFDLPHTTFYRFLGPNYYLTSVFAEYMAHR